MKVVLCTLLLLSVLNFGAANDYVISDSGTQSITHAKPVTLKTTTLSVTGKTISVAFEYKFGSTTPTTTTATEKDIIICCVSEVSATTDNLAKFMIDKCFATQLKATATAGSLTHNLAFGVKASGNFLPTMQISTDVVIPAHSSGTYTTTAVQLDSIQQAGMGLSTTFPGTITHTCGHLPIGTAAATNLITGTPAHPTTGATTFKVTGSGTACSTTTTSKSGAVTQGVVATLFLSGFIALLSLE